MLPRKRFPVGIFPFLVAQRKARRPSGNRAPAGASQSAGLPSASRGTQGQTAEAFLLEQPVVPRKHRQFELPPNVHVQPVKQTLVQLDVPPDIVLKQEIPLPTALLWQPAPMRRQFIAPPLKQVTKVAPI